MPYCEVNLLSMSDLVKAIPPFIVYKIEDKREVKIKTQSEKIFEGRINSVQCQCVKARQEHNYGQPTHIDLDYHGPVWLEVSTNDGNVLIAVSKIETIW